MGHVPIVAGGAGLPTQGQANLVGFLDCDPDRFPHGCDLIIMRPGELAPAGGPLHVPRGALLFIAPAEVAHHMRAAMKQEIEKLKAQANGVGRRG